MIIYDFIKYTISDRGHVFIQINFIANSKYGIFELTIMSLNIMNCIILKIEKMKLYLTCRCRLSFVNNCILIIRILYIFKLKTVCLYFHLIL
jgi:hypothetical protein